MTDISTGLYAQGAIMAALLRRTRTGKGAKIDCSLLSTQVTIPPWKEAHSFLNSRQISLWKSGKSLQAQLFLFDRLTHLGFNWLIDWLIDWSIDQLIVRLIHWLIDWWMNWLIDWLVGWWLIDWLIDWLIGRLIDVFVAEFSPKRLLVF